MNNFRYIFLFVILISITSCNHHLREKKVSGVYMADFANIKGIDLNISDTTFTKSEKKYYSNFKLFVNYDKSFYFSKPFYGELDTIKGIWEPHSDPLALIFVLKGKNSNYNSPIRKINDIQDSNYVVAFPNNYSRVIPLRKIKDQFPKLSQD